MISDFDPETAVARELVLRLASLLWRLRRANAIESNLLEIQAEELQERGSSVPTRAQASDPRNYPAVRPIDSSTELEDRGERSRAGNDEVEERLGHHELSSVDYKATTRQLTYCFLRLANLDSGVFERLSRYEAALWRRTVQTLSSSPPDQVSLKFSGEHQLVSKKIERVPHTAIYYPLCALPGPVPGRAAEEGYGVASLRSLNPNSTNRVLPCPDGHSGPPMDSAIVSGTLFTLMAIGLVMAGIAFMMM